MVDEVVQAKSQESQEGHKAGQDAAGGRDIFSDFSQYDLDDIVNLNRQERTNSAKSPDTSDSRSGAAIPSYMTELPNILFDGKPEVRDAAGLQERVRPRLADSSSEITIPTIPGFDPSSLRIGEGRGPNFQFPRRLGGESSNFYDNSGRPFQNGGEQPLIQGLRMFMQSPEVQGHLRQVMNNPELKRGITDVVNMVGREVGVNVDAERGEINLSMDFAQMYDRAVPRDSAEYKPEVRAMLSNLESVRISADRVHMKFSSQQKMSLGDKGIQKLYDLNLGAENGEVSMRYETTPTRLVISDIQGMSVKQKTSANQQDINSITFDTTDEKNPTGAINMDNPFPRPEFLPANIPWAETVTVPMMLSKQQQEEMATKLPGSIKALDAVVSGVKSGDLTQTLEKLDMSQLTGMLGLSSRSMGTMDITSAWRPPNIPDLIRKHSQDKFPNPQRNIPDNIRR